MRSELLSAGFSTELCLQWEPNTSCLILQVFWRRFISRDFSFSLCVTAKQDYCFCSSWFGDFSFGCAVQKLARLFLGQLLEPKLFLTTSTWKPSHSLGCLNNKRLKKKSRSTTHLPHNVSLCSWKDSKGCWWYAEFSARSERRREQGRWKCKCWSFARQRHGFFQCNAHFQNTQKNTARSIRFSS